MKIIIYASIHPSIQRVCALGQGSEWLRNDILVVADYIILENAPQGPFSGMQLMYMLNIIILYEPALQLICNEQEECWNAL